MKASFEFVEKYYTDDIKEKDSEESIWARQWNKEVKGKKVLNTGCGPQLYDDALAFGEIPEELVGIDLNETNIEFLNSSTHPKLIEAREKLKKQGTKIELFLQDTKDERADFLERFDAVFSSGFLEIFDAKDAEEIVELLYKYLKPNGRLVVVSWGGDLLSQDKLKEREQYNWYQRTGLYPEKMQEIVEKAGLRVVKKGVYKVKNPEEYKWATIYGFVAEKH